MAGIQSYSVDWTVDIEPEGDVSEDVREIRHVIEAGNPRNVQVKLDTSQRPHALLEEQPITVTLTDGNQTITFSGFTDEISDTVAEPKVNVEARAGLGALDDTDVVGSYDGRDIWEAIDALIDTGPSQLRGVSFDDDAHRDEYGIFANGIDYGTVEVYHRGQFGVEQNVFNQHETIPNARGRKAELQVDRYLNTSSTTFTMDITGEDSDGDKVMASLDLPPASSAQEAFGTENIQLALSDGNRLWTKVRSLTTDIPSNIGTNTIILEGSINNWVRTNYNYGVGADKDMRDLMDWIVSHIQMLDGGQNWDYIIENGQLTVQPVDPNEPSVWTFVEGDNVIRPKATRNLDHVKNYIHVSGDRDINTWIWAWDGEVIVHETSVNPHDFGVWPNDTSGPRTNVSASTPGTNDVDEIGIRAQKITDPSITSWEGSLEVAKDTFARTYGTRVSGVAPVAGVLDARIGDLAEVYYPSRGIPQRVEDNVYSVQKVEHIVTPDEAKTNVEFGTARPTMSNVIGDTAASTSGNPQSRVSYGGGSATFTGGSGDGGADPVIGTITAVNSDGTVDIDGDDGQTYENVRIV